MKLSVPYLKVCEVPDEMISNLLSAIDESEPRQRRYSLQCDIFPEDDSRFERFLGLYPKKQT